MKTTPESARARRYLLGQSSEQESAILERAYFRDDASLDRVAAVEDDLIEDYLGYELSSPERERFERAYLSADHHRVRVEAVRRLIAHAARAVPPWGSGARRFVRPHNRTVGLERLVPSGWRLLWQRAVREVPESDFTHAGGVERGA